MPYRSVNLFQAHLDLLKPHLSKRLFEKVTTITGKVSKRFFKSRPQVEPSKAMEEFAKMYSSQGIYQVPSEMGLTHKETEFFNKLRSRLGPRNIRRLADVGYTVHGYSKRCIASVCQELRDFTLDESKLKGLPNLHHANDFSAKNLMHEIMQRASKGEKSFKLLDVGAGTGGTTESLVHHAIAEAKKAGVNLTDVSIDVTCIDQNPDQILALNQKADLLRKKCAEVQLPLKINVVKVDIAEFLKSLQKMAKKGQTYDCVVASYILHHLHDRDKKKVVKIISKITRKGGLFAYNDCDGHSEINMRYFNCVNLLHFSVFHTKKEAAKLLSRNGFSVRDATTPEVKRLFQENGTDFLKKILDDEKSHLGYCTIGVKK